MASKVLLGIFILSLATSLNADGNLKVGDFSENSKLLYHGNFDAMGIFFLKRSETFDIKLTDGGKIKAIDIQDLRGDSASWILAGGVDEDFATIKLESSRGKGYNFVIDIYGYDDEYNGDEQPADEQPAEEQPADEQPADEQPADEQPADEQPAEEQPADDQPAEEQPAEDQPEEGLKESEDQNEEKFD